MTSPPGNDASRPSVRPGPAQTSTLPEANLTHGLTDVIRFPLSTAQARQLAPLVHRAAEWGENVLFVATAIPYWSWEDESVVWQLETVIAPARIGEKIKKLIQKGIKN
jgi:hypothetical protein